MATREEILTAAHRRNLEDEDIGVRHRMEHYYIPLFQSYGRTRGLPAGEVRVLDCGCGNGLSVDRLAAAGFAAVGIDKWQIREAQWQGREPFPHTGLCLADATRLPFKDAAFDIVMSCGVLEHIGVHEDYEPRYRVAPTTDQAREREQFFAEAVRVLRPAGVIYLDHPNGAFPIDFWHTDHDGGPRWHALSEKFLPTVREVEGLCRIVDSRLRVRPLSPAGRFLFRRVRRGWYGRMLRGPMEAFFRILSRPPLSMLAGSSLNPYLVIEISREA